MKWITMLALVFTIAACKKNNDKPLRYFEVGMRIATDQYHWRDTSFVVATRDQQVLTEVEAQLAKPEPDRKKLVAGKLRKGSGGYNKNGGLSFSWHLDDWKLTDMTIEIMDGLPYTDVELNNDYWMDTVKSFGSWASYIKREISL